MEVLATARCVTEAQITQIRIAQEIDDRSRQRRQQIVSLTARTRRRNHRRPRMRAEQAGNGRPPSDDIDRLDISARQQSAFHARSRQIQRRIPNRHELFQKLGVNRLGHRRSMGLMSQPRRKILRLVEKFMSHIASTLHGVEHVDRQVFPEPIP